MLRLTMTILPLTVLFALMDIAAAQPDVIVNDEILYREDKP